MKKIILILLVALLIFSLCGCFFQIDRPQIRVNMKQDVMADNGISAAVFEDRIYYMSNEEKTSGIYSMNMDGGDVQLEVSNPSILYMQIFEDEIVYCGIYEADQSFIPTDGSGGYFHKIYTCNVDEAHDLVKNISYLNNLDEYNNIDNVTFFNFSGDNVFTVCGNIYHYQGSQTAWYDTFIKYGDSLNPDKNYKFEVEYVYNEIDSGGNIVEAEESKTISFIINKISDLLVISSEDLKMNEVDRFNFYSIIDLSNKNYFVESGAWEVITPLYYNDNFLYLGYTDGRFYNNGLIIEIDLETMNIRSKYPDGIKDGDYVVCAKVCNDEIVVLTADSEKARDMYTYEQNQKLQIFDTESLEMEEIFIPAKKEHILYFDDDYIVTLKDGAICRYNFTDNKIGNEYILAEILDIENIEKSQVDFAGDWMFFYKIHGGYNTSSGSDIAQQLLYKINIKNGEVIENTEEIDFSQFNEYRPNYRYNG